MAKKRMNNRGMLMVATALFLFIMVATIEGLSSLDMWGGSNSDVINGTAGNMTGDIDDPSALVGITNPGYSTWDYYAGTLWSYVGMAATAITVFLTAIWHCFSVGFYLQSLFPFIPTWFAAIFTLTYWVLFSIDLYQLKTGKSVRDFL